MTWEERLAKRKREELEGKRDPLVPASVVNGGQYQMKNRMSREEFKQQHNRHGLFNMMDRTMVSSGENTPLQPNEADEMEAINLILEKKLEEYDNAQTQPSKDALKQFTIIQTEKMKKEGRRIKLYEANSGKIEGNL